MMKLAGKPFFLPQFRILGFLLLLFGIPGIFTLPIFWLFKLPIWLLAITLGLFLLTAKHAFELDEVKKCYRESISMLGVTIGKWVPFNQIEKIYLKESNVSQTMWMGPLQNTIRDKVFNAYVKFSDEEKSFIGSRKDKQKFLSELDQYGSRLGVEVFDYTTEA